MSKKKLIPLALAGILAASLALPAFAAEEETPAPNTKTELTGAYEEIPIAVVVPQTGEVTINPYKLPIGWKDSEGNMVEVVGQQITTKPMAIMNQGSTDLEIGAKVSTKRTSTDSKVTLVATENALDNTAKNAYVYLEVLTYEPTTTSVTLKKLAGDSTDANAINDAVLKACADETNWTAEPGSNGGAALRTVKTLPLGDVSTGTTTVSTAESPNTPLGVVKKAKTAATDTDAAVYAVGSIALFRLSGKCSTGNTTTSTKWATTDGFTSTIAFTFKPV